MVPIRDLASTFAGERLAISRVALTTDHVEEEALAESPRLATSLPGGIKTTFLTLPRAPLCVINVKVTSCALVSGGTSDAFSGL